MNHGAKKGTQQKWKKGAARGPTFGQVDNLNGFKGTLFDADTATYAQRLTDVSKLGCWANLLFIIEI